MYLGLTGRSIGRADAYALGLLTHCIPAARFEEIKAALADTWPVDTILDERQVDPGPGELRPFAEHIARAFSAPTVEEIIARLQVIDGARARLGGGRHRRSQFALAHLAQGHAPAPARCTRARPAPDAAASTTVSPAGFLDGHDFYEGVRAALIDKDGTPRWQPARLEDVTAGDGRRLFRAYGSCTSWRCRRAPKCRLRACSWQF